MFAQIAGSLQSLVAELARDDLPHDPCRELVLYSTKLAEAVSEELGLQEAEKPAVTLSQALANGIYMAPPLEAERVENPL